jgi:Class II flagellar assembly regulator
MSTIDGLGAPGPIRNTRTASGGKSSSFSVPADAPGSAASGSGVTPASASALGCLIALQEPGGETVQDRAARRRGRDVLQALADLQRAMLADTDAPVSAYSADKSLKAVLFGLGSDRRHGYKPARIRPETGQGAPKPRRVNGRLRTRNEQDPHA